MRQEGTLKQLMEEYGSKSVGQGQDAQQDATQTHNKPETPQHKKEGKAYMLEEERETGAVNFSTYRTWLQHMGSWFLVTALTFTYALAQVFQVFTTVWLGWWSTDQKGLTQGVYQSIYAGKWFLATFCAVCVKVET